MPSSVTPKKIESIRLYQKEYTQFRGVDFSTDPTQVADYRSPYALNLISDLAGFPEKRVGWRKILDTGKRINGIHHAVFASGASMRFVHAGNTLYTCLLYYYRISVRARIVRFRYLQSQEQLCLLVQ